MIRHPAWLGVGTMAFLCATPATAQNVVIAGSVRSASGDPIPQVRLRAMAARAETITNERGEYRLIFPGPAQQDRSEVIRVERLGFGRRDIPVTLRDFVMRLDIELTEVAIGLDEVVVTGTAGTQIRRAQPGVIATVPVADILRTMPVPTLPEALVGRVASVNVTPSSGSSGSAQTIWLRGGTSIALSNEPLVFVDGVRADTRLMGTNGGQASSRWFDIDPADVDHIEIAKGPAAATLYGANASTGVIQIFTKRGAVGQGHVLQTIESELGAIDANWDPPANFARCRPQDVVPTSPAILCHGLSEGALVNDNPLQRLSLPRGGSASALRWRARGGGSEFGVYTSLNLDRESGTLPQNSFGRAAFRLNTTWSLSPTVVLDAGFGLMRTRTAVPQNGDHPDGMLAGMIGNPLTVGTLRDGWFGAPGAAILTVEQVNRVLRATPTFQVRHATGRIDQRVVLGMDASNSRGVLFVPLRSDNAFSGVWRNGMVAEDQIAYQVYTVDYLANVRLLDRAPTGVRISVSGGAQYLETNDEVVSAIGFGLVSNEARRVSDAAERSGSQGSLRTRSFGLLAQGELAYRDRAYAQVGVRADRHSAFGTGTSAQLFPKVGISFVVADGERYRSPVPVLSSLRLRAAYGTSGRAPPQNEAGATYVAAPFILSPGRVQQGVAPFSPGNPDLKPERGSEIELGIDASAVDERLALELTYFRKRSTDLLFRPPLPPSTGFPRNPFANVGSVLNHGVEAVLNARADLRGGMHVATQLAVSTLHNELTGLGSVAPFSSWGRFTVGRPLGARYDYRVVSIDPVAGRAVITDTTEFVGNALPSLVVGWNATLSFHGNLHLHTSIDGKSGYYQHNFNADVRDRVAGLSERSARAAELSVEERLRRFGPFVTESGRSISPQAVGGPYIQDASFVRWRELSLTWDLPSAWASHGRIQSTSLTLAARNLQLWTDYEGDPEAVPYIATIRDGGAGQYGQPNLLTMPQSRRVSARFTVRF